MAKQLGACLLCKTAQAREEHHCYPVEYGGARDGPLVPLCPNCHTDVHTTADRVWEGSLALDAVQPEDKRKLVGFIHAQHLVFVNNGGEAPDARRRIVAHLSEEEQGFARLIKRHHGFSSLEVMIKTMLRREAERIQRGG